jgi:hypothetical protein
VFAAPHFYWAVGGRAGLGAQTAAADAALGETWFAAYNVIAGCLGIAGALVAYVIATGSSNGRLRRFLLGACAVASVALLLRGGLGLTLLGISALDDAPDEPFPGILLAIEPSFVLGGLAFGGMVLDHRRGAGAGDLVRSSGGR